MKTAKQYMRIAAVMLLMVTTVNVLFAGNINNNGTINNTNTMTVTGNFQNYNGANGGTVTNSSTITVGGFFTNTNAGAPTDGSVTNYIGGTPGTIAVTGNYVNTEGTTDNNLANATIRVAGALQNTTGANFNTIAGTVEYNGSAAQTVISAVAQDAGVAAYGKLLLTNGDGTVTNAKTLNGIIKAGDVTLSTQAYFDIAANDVTVSGNATKDAGSVFDADAGTVRYYGTGAQDVLPGAYANLYTTVTGAATKLVSGDLTVGTLLNNGANATLDVNGNFTFNGLNSALTNDAVATINASAVVTISDATTAIGGTFVYDGAAAQDVKGAYYNNLTLNGSAKSFNAVTARVSGVYSIGTSASRNYGTSTFQYYAAAQTIVGETGANKYNVLSLFNGTKALSGSTTTTSLVVDASVNTTGLTVGNGQILTIDGGDLDNAGVITNNGTVTVN